MSEEEPEPLAKETARTLVNDGDVVVELQDEVDETFSQQLIEADRPVGQQQVLSALWEVFQMEINDPDDAYELAESVYGYVISAIDNRVQVLRELGASKELIRILNSLVIRYNDAAMDSYLSDAQGDNYWTDMDSELVIRGEAGAIGFNHQLDIGKSRRVQLSTSLESNMALVHRLLAEQARALDVFGVNTVEQLDPEQVEEIVELAQNIKQSADKYVEQVEEEGRG